MYIFNVNRARKKSLIEVMDDKTLYDLHLEILNEFELDNDHMYGFAIGNKFWGGHIVAEGNPFGPEKDMRVADLMLNEQLIYMYDYGDEIQFKVELVEIK